MNPKEYLTVRKSFSLSKRDLEAIDALAEAHCLRNRSEVVRFLVRRAISGLHRHERRHANG